MGNIIIFIIVVALLILCLSGNILYKRFGWFKWLYHNIFGWHEPVEADYFDFDIENSCIVATCKYCGKEIISNDFINWKEKE